MFLLILFFLSAQKKKKKNYHQSVLNLEMTQWFASFCLKLTELLYIDLTA